MADKSVGTESFATAVKKKVTKRLRWAFIGNGGISTTHIRAIEKIPEIEIVAGCDIKKDRRDLMLSDFGVPKMYEKWDDMLKEVKPDVVDVCTPNGVHAPAVIAALKAGCHVITEKPMAMNPQECKDMIAAAKKAKKLLCCGFQYRYHAKSQFGRRLMDSGKLGDIMFVKVQALRRHGIPNWGVFGQKALQGGGPMIDIGVHMLECAHYMIGEPKPIAASGNTWTYYGNKAANKNLVCPWPNWDYKTFTVEDLAIGQIRFKNGAIMQVESSFSAHIDHNIMNVTIVGTKGGYSWDDATYLTDLEDRMVNAKANWLPNEDFGTLFVAKLQNFVDAILTGSPLCVPGEEGLAVQQMIDGIYRSAAAGKEVTIG
ncbi:MAG: Gfo/Idh/MocA family oxidoreductase [Victivallales bacterium]|nr:Gfo/Idh/MocA family oxidoreductase [Victivallales bacterium]